jgi:hypothetical protein
MNRIYKYFQFNKTINGTSYFLRNFLSTIGGFVSGFLIGIGLSSGIYSNFYIGIMLLFPSLWLQFTTVYKRINAFYPDRVKTYSSCLIAFQFLSQILDGEIIIAPLLTLGLLIVGVLLIFSNSGIQNHEG